MTHHTLLNRIIILGFMGLVGFALAKGISSGSFIGILLALVSFGAGIYFMHLWTKARRELESQTQ